MAHLPMKLELSLVILALQDRSVLMVSILSHAHLVFIALQELVMIYSHVPVVLLIQTTI